MSKVDCVTLENFEQLSVIGKGSYAKVVLAKKKGGERLYAMKILKKKHIQKTKQQGQVMA
jgi:serine/threonine protein kinase